jgi:hypothetical protein
MGKTATKAKLKRKAFVTSRQIEYVSRKELTAQTGHDITGSLAPVQAAEHPKSLASLSHTSSRPAVLVSGCATTEGPHIWQR